MLPAWERFASMVGFHDGDYNADANAVRVTHAVHYCHGDQDREAH